MSLKYFSELQPWCLKLYAVLIIADTSDNNDQNSINENIITVVN